MALENYLEETKLETANITFTDVKDNLSANQRQALKTFKTNSEMNLRKADKGTMTVVMDTTQKIEEELEQVSNKKFYKTSWRTHTIPNSRLSQNNSQHIVH